MNSVDLSIKSIFKESFEELKQYFWFYTVVAIIYCIIQAIIVSTSFLLLPLELLKQGITKNIMTQQVSINFFLYLFLNIFFYVVHYLILIGLAYQAYLVKRSSFYHWKQIFKDLSWKVIGRIALGAFLYSAGVTLGFFALIIPGIIVALVWCLWPFIIFEGNFTAWQSLGESYRRIKGNELKIFLLLVITYSLGFLIFIPVFFLYIVGFLSAVFLTKALTNFLGFGVVDLYSFSPTRFQTLSQHVSAILFAIPLVSFTFLLAIFGKIFAMLVVAEIYYRLLPEHKTAEISGTA